jgi:hypothetical protein
VEKKPAKKSVRAEWVTLPDGRVVKNHERHEFSKSTKILLMQMAGGMCSKPGCFVHTVAANVSQSRQAWIHNVAHICSAAPGVGAARYDPDQTEEQRKSHENGIWLCANHATIIDSDEENYPVELLRDWKKQALRRSNDLLGLQSFSPNELRRAIDSAVGHHKSYEITHTSSPLITESLTAYQSKWNELDPHFHVKVTAVNGTVHHEISPKTDATPEVTMVFESNSDFDPDKAWQEMIESGEPIEVSTNDFKFQGSTLFESLNDVAVNGTFMLIPGKRELETTIYIVNDDAEFELGSTTSYMSLGTKQFNIEGVALDGLFAYKYLIQSSSEVVANFNFDVASWQGQKIVEAKHFNRAKKACDFIIKHPNSRISIEVVFKGEPMRLWEGDSSGYDDLFWRLKNIILLTESARSLSLHFDDSLRFKTLDLSPKHQGYVELYAKLIQGDVIRQLPVDEYIFSARVAKDESEKILDFCSNEVVQVTIFTTPSIDFFGNKVSFPKISKTVSSYDMAYFSGISGDDRKALWFIGTANDSSHSVITIDPEGKFILHGDSKLDEIGASK